MYRLGRLAKRYPATASRLFDEGFFATRCKAMLFAGNALLAYLVVVVVVSQFLTFQAGVCAWIGILIFTETFLGTVLYMERDGLA